MSSSKKLILCFTIGLLIGTLICGLCFVAPINPTEPTDEPTAATTPFEAFGWDEVTAAIINTSVPDMDTMDRIEHTDNPYIYIMYMTDYIEYCLEFDSSGALIKIYFNTGEPPEDENCLYIAK